MSRAVRGAVRRVKRKPRLWLAGLLLGRRYQVIRARPGIVAFLRSRRIDLVIDVGANEGQFAAMLRAGGYDGEILSLEPVAAVFERLAARAADDPRWQVRQCGAGARAGSARIGVAASSVFSSINPTTAAADAFEAKSRAVRHETIQIVALDELCAGMDGNIFVKIDTQGYEAQVVAGARALLGRARGVQLELPCIHLYEGGWSIAEAMAAMQALGFALCQAEPVNFSKVDPVALVELDCLFGRADQSSSA